VEQEGLFTGLRLFFSLFRDACAKRSEEEFLALTNAGISRRDVDSFQAVYERAITLIEDAAANAGFRDDLLDLQRRLYTELENLLSLSGHDSRHHFCIVIPVADRPVMLRNCVESLIEQCRIFGYGGMIAGPEGEKSYSKISLFIVDDSREEKNAKAHREIADAACAAGIDSRYIGLDEQTVFMKQQLRGLFGEKLSGLIGGYNGRIHGHKGASISRNIAYLFIHAMLNGHGELPVGDFTTAGPKMLFYFLDSDEEFRIRVLKGDTAADIQFINYFFRIDRIFSSSETEVMTGKVVGDPPVTPAVMINTFLGDLIAFFEAASKHDIRGECPFHETCRPQPFTADYHDMVKLFGYQGSSVPKKYVCDLHGTHTLGDCFDHFSEKAMGFFHGRHPTRVQYYRHSGGFTKTEPARTVYTGNYVFRPNGLRHFIPFAELGLRMAGPTLGRILKSRIGDRFASANLPLLHRRTVTGRAQEFRSGIITENQTIDLSMELSRQFWGDVMLFSVETLASAGYPVSLPEFRNVVKVVNKTQSDLWSVYRQKHAETEQVLSVIKKYLSGQKYWWNNLPEMRESLKNFHYFFSQAERNFGPKSEGCERLAEQMREGTMTNRIIDAIHLYCEDERAWNEALEEIAL
jgi:hypothetical protein